MSRALWRPDPARETAMSRFLARMQREYAVPADGGYRALWEWSVREKSAFWAEVWAVGEVIADSAADGRQWETVLERGDRMQPPGDEGPRWFRGARLNFAENLLRHRDERDAIVAWTESGHRRSLTYAELASETARFAAGLRDAGVGPGDRVAGFLPNIPEAVIAMLATASIGAIWSSCSPDFGAGGVLDRFGQIAPTVLVCADGYRYAGKAIDVMDRVREIVSALPSVRRVVLVPYLDDGADAGSIPRGVLWSEFSRDMSEPHFTRLPFDHPLYIMYSSGTTGLPKCMVHGAGGTLLQHLKEHLLHGDLRRDDTIFYFTTCGWMMWNWLVSALAVGARVVLYDGSPMAPRASQLWDMAAAERITVFGTSAKYLALAEKENLAPARTHDLSSLRAILSTGSPLAEHSFDYVYRDVKHDVQLASISGGTDLISCFALGNPIVPVHRGEIQSIGLGMDVAVLDEKGTPIVGEAGELCCRSPFPSMPVSFWNDPDGSRYRHAYFDHVPGVWRHGDWSMRVPHGTDGDGVVIYGRSDATLNPGGVRIGTAEIYRQVEQLPDVVECLAIGQELRDRGDVRVVLFVRLRDGATLTSDLRDRIRSAIRDGASPHHVPRKIVQVADIPRTISGKISEIAVREVVHGRPVTNTDALANPGSLELFRDLPELQS